MCITLGYNFFIIIKFKSFFFIFHKALLLSLRYPCSMSKSNYLKNIGQWSATFTIWIINRGLLFESSGFYNFASFYTKRAHSPRGIVMYTQRNGYCYVHPAKLLLHGTSNNFTIFSFYPFVKGI